MDKVERNVFRDQLSVESVAGGGFGFGEVSDLGPVRWFRDGKGN